MFNAGQFEVSLRTDQGRVRDHNEDFVASREPINDNDENQNGWLFILADGVGGADSGEIASQHATEQTIHHYLASQETSNWGERLKRAMESANADLRKLVAEKYQGQRMATTMVSVVIHDLTATFANVGDSRAYRWQNGNLRQVTKDQSLVARLLEEGAITVDEAINHPRKNVILHSLGPETNPEIDLFEEKLEPGDQLILCSDGLTRHVSDEEIAALVGEQEPPEATEKLIALANERGGEDNISVVILRVREQPGPRVVATDQNLYEVSGSGTAKISESGRRFLWVYITFLALVQIVLILLIWNLIQG